MSALQNAIIAGPCQHLFQMPHAKSLTSAICGRKKLAGNLRGIDHARCIKAIVAVAANGGGIFAEMFEQYRTTASRSFSQSRQCINPVFLSQLPRIRLFLQPLPCDDEIPRRPEQMRYCRIAIAARPPAFLIIGLDRFGDACVRDKAHIGLVDPHAKGDSRNHHHILAGDKFRLGCGTGLRFHPGMIIACAPTGACDQGGKLFCPVTGCRIDYAGTIPAAYCGSNGCAFVGHICHSIADIGTIEAGDDCIAGMDAQLLGDVFPCMRISGSGERQPGDGCKIIH